MNEKVLLNYYRNNYEIAKFDLAEKDKELEEYKLLNKIQSDMIDSLNKRLNKKEKNFKRISIETLCNIR